MQSAECIRKLKAEIEHLKITRFEAKRENHRIKTSLSWRLTWPLRALRDAGMDFVSKSRHQFRLFAAQLSSASVAASADDLAAVDVGYDEQQPEVDRAEHPAVDTRLVGLGHEARRQSFSSLMRSRGPVPPIIVLNLARAFRQKYNVIICALQDGALVRRIPRRKRFPDRTAECRTAIVAVPDSAF